MTIAELKEKNITELTKIARSLDLPAQVDCASKTLYSRSFKRKAKKKGTFSPRASSKFCPTAMAFCVRPITTICQVPTISMSRLRRSASLT